MLMLFGGTITQPLSDAGGIVPAGTLSFYATGTTTPKNVFHDADGGSAWDFPVTLDGNGRAVIFLDNDGAYDVIFKDADGAEIWSLEKVISPAPVL